MRAGQRSRLHSRSLAVLLVQSSILLSLCSRGQAVQAENVTVLEGGTAHISCRLQNYDGSIVVIQNPRRQTLFFNGTRALKDERFQMVLFTPRLVRITLSNVSVSDEGGYFCQLYTDSTHHQVATLSVVVPPEVPNVVVKSEAVEGGEVELTCVVSQQENGKTVSVSNTIRLPVERKDNGAALSCEASHPALVGQKRVRHYRLDVHFAPTVRISPPQGILREGDSLSLTCSVTGNPLPRDILWSRVNDTLPERAEISGTTLVMSRLSQTHNGTYLCQAHNNYGRAADQYTLLVYDRQRCGLLSEDEEGEGKEEYVEEDKVNKSKGEKQTGKEPIGTTSHPVISSSSLPWTPQGNLTPLILMLFILLCTLTLLILLFTLTLLILILLHTLMLLILLLTLTLLILILLLALTFLILFLLLTLTLLTLLQRVWSSDL
ncbi:Cell adhesion molecule 4 [Bagarius yarrelli]|uniref:Cell adhesion molecule 4 n=1 Tax=Bagarius yarrelli TaxID=175774 RepID=A0A556TZ20_BAGYA|nr:Cell adhesion molecule 4 [Bagarius yarrelli]